MDRAYNNKTVDEIVKKARHPENQQPLTLDELTQCIRKLKRKKRKIVKELNSNLIAKVRTKYGLTRTIQIRDSIRQGGVLSVIEYANLMDEIAKELQEHFTGYQKIWNNTTMGCLLWMDDVVLIHHDKEEIQKMLNITNEIAKRYHIKFGKEKSQILTIGNTEETSN